MRSNEMWRDGLTQSQLYELSSSTNYYSFLHITEAIISFLFTYLEMAAVNASHPSFPSPAPELVPCPLLGLLFLSFPCQHSGPRPTQLPEVPNLGAWAPSLVNGEKLSLLSHLLEQLNVPFSSYCPWYLGWSYKAPQLESLSGGVSQSPGPVLHHVNIHLFI